ncbi:hypothetical protein [Aurantibacillus circumpalustris]|uniref:hypothetical protein n=1 Tax=Aurantibacillus circumpalustris TaxID=3036359 RepID=UPI00295AF213|nr:hypothetical protein [Aurantibacillus circumpalustris]
MQEDANLIEPLYERIEEYGKTSYVLFKLKALEKATGIVSTYVSKTIIISVFAMAALLVTIAFSMWLGELLGKLYFGFICLAGIYSLLGFVLYFFMNKYIKKRVMNSIVAQMLESQP